MNALALTYLSVIDDLFGDFFSKSCLPLRIRQILLQMLEKGKQIFFIKKIQAHQHELNFELNEAITLYLKIYQIQETPCIKNDESPEDNYLYIDQKLLISRIKECHQIGNNPILRF